MLKRIRVPEIQAVFQPMLPDAVVKGFDGITQDRERGKTIVRYLEKFLGKDDGQIRIPTMLNEKIPVYGGEECPRRYHFFAQERHGAAPKKHMETGKIIYWEPGDAIIVTGPTGEMLPGQDNTTRGSDVHARQHLALFWGENLCLIECRHRPCFPKKINLQTWKDARIVTQADLAITRHQIVTSTDGGVTNFFYKQTSVLNVTLKSTDDFREILKNAPELAGMDQLASAAALAFELGFPFSPGGRKPKSQLIRQWTNEERATRPVWINKLKVEETHVVSTGLIEVKMSSAGALPVANDQPPAAPLPESSAEVQSGKPEPPATGKKQKTRKNPSKPAKG